MPPTFLAVVNFIRSNGRTSNLSDIVESLSLTALMNYLRRSHDYFVKFRLPAIRRKLIEAIDCSARNQIAFLILKFYDEFASEVGRHMDYEDKHIHTYVTDLMKGVKTSPDVNIHKLSPSASRQPRAARKKPVRTEKHHHQVLSHG